MRRMVDQCVRIEEQTWEYNEKKISRVFHSPSLSSSSIYLMLESIHVMTQAIYILGGCQARRMIGRCGRGSVAHERTIWMGTTITRCHCWCCFGLCQDLVQRHLPVRTIFRDTHEANANKFCREGLKKHKRIHRFHHDVPGRCRDGKVKTDTKVLVLLIPTRMMTRIKMINNRHACHCPFFLNDGS